MDTTIYCPHCGQPMTVAREHLTLSLECPHCRHVFNPSGTLRHEGAARPIEAASYSGDARPRKSKVIAGVLGIFLGGWGVHRFYLGFIGIGILQIIVSLFGCVSCIGVMGLPVPVGAAWGFIEGILCLAGKMKDAQGRELVD